MNKVKYVISPREIYKLNHSGTLQDIIRKLFINYNHVTKILSVLAFAFIIYCLIIIIKTPPANSYEISVYDIFPWYFWIYLLLAFACGDLILLIAAFSKRWSERWYIGAIINTLINFLLILLPISRGYFLNESNDEAIHLGHIIDILVTNHFGVIDVYPLSHILVSELSIIANINQLFVMKLTPSIFYLLYIVGLILLFKSIKLNKGQTIIAFIFASAPIYSYFCYQFLPTQLFLYNVPIILSIFFRKSRSKDLLQYNFILIILILSLAFLHPLGCLLLISLFLIFEISTYIYPYFTNHTYDILSVYKSGSTFYPIAVLSVTFIIWFSATTIFNASVARAYHAFISDYGVAPLDVVSAQLNRAQFSHFELIALILNTYGQAIIYMFLASIAILIAFRRLILKNTLKFETFFLASSVIIITAFYIVTLINAFIITGASLRVLCWPIMLSVILDSLIYYDWIKSNRGLYRKAYIIILFVLILSATFLGVFNIYPSPIIKQANTQATYKDVAAIRWTEYSGINEINNKECIYYYMGTFAHTGNYAVFGFNRSFTTYQLPHKHPSPHFGYDTHSTIAESLGHSCYLNIPIAIKESYAKIWIKRGSFTLDDFKNLSVDSELNRIYFNGESELWRIQ